MESKKMNLKEKFQIIIALIILVAFLGAYFNIPAETINQVVEWLVSIMIGILLAAVSGALVEAFTGDLLKTIFIRVEIKGFSFSISIFVIATIIVKILLFGF
jgi:hypothetical protein